MIVNHLYDAVFEKYRDAETVFIKTADGQTVTHGELIRQSARLANALDNMGLVKGDRVAIQVEKSIEMVFMYAACIQSGLVFLPLNTAYTANEVRYFVEDSGARLLICDSSKEGDLTTIAETVGAKLHTLNGDGTGSLMEFAETYGDMFETVAVHEDDIAAFLYTSGTTGRSKGAMLTHNNLLSNGLTLTEHWQFSRQDVLLHALPLFHTHGLFVAINVALISGAAMIMLPKFDVRQILDNMPDITAMMGVPTFYTRLLSEPNFDKELVSKVRLFISGSAPLLAETHILFEQRTGHRILERYGMTETNMITSNPYAGERRAGTVGFPLPNVELKVTHPDTGEELSNGDIGVLEVRGPNVFRGYWNMPEKTKAELRENGFFITGDLGKIDSDGYVHIIGRDKDLIISGGFNIYPKEIEVVLDEQNGVIESAVVGVPHPDFGETPVAIVVREKDCELDLESIHAEIKKALARFKHPRKIIVADSLPRNTMGKVQKNVLREDFENLFMN